MAPPLLTDRLTRLTRASFRSDPPARVRAEVDIWRDTGDTRALVTPSNSIVGMYGRALDRAMYEVHSVDCRSHRILDRLCGCFRVSTDCTITAVSTVWGLNFSELQQCERIPLALCHSTVSHTFTCACVLFMRCMGIQRLNQECTTTTRMDNIGVWCIGTFESRGIEPIIYRLCNL